MTALGRGVGRAAVLRPAPPARRPYRPDPWTLLTLLLALLMATPVLAVLFTALQPSGDAWRHLASTVLPRYVRTTLLLMAGVGAGTLVIGVGTAWLVSACRFPGSRVFAWALMLPLAVPAYIVAFVTTDLLDYAGPVQGALRAAFGWETKRDYRFPEVRSLGGAIVVMTLVFYPYVYLLARAAFLRRSRSAIEAGRMLGLGPWATFWRVALPLARPGIVAGVALVLMETLNDFGAVSYFAVQTFTAGIYQVWLNMYDVTGAAKLASALLVFVLASLAAERLARRGRGFGQSFAGLRAPAAHRLTGWRAALAASACGLPVLLGFGLPAARLVQLAVTTPTYYGEVVHDAARTLGLAAATAFLAVLLGLVLAYGLRLRRGRTALLATRVAGIGYAVPGSVIAVGVLLPFAALDNAVDGLARAWLGVSTGLVLSGTAAALVFAYLVRFLAVSLGAVESGLARVTPSIDDAARSLGHGPASTLWRVHLPLLRGSVLTAAILVFVDTVKELPATLLLRPFDFNTLATRVYELASDQRLAEASPSALLIVAAGILPVIVLGVAARPGGDAEHDGRGRR